MSERKFDRRDFLIYAAVTAVGAGFVALGFKVFSDGAREREMERIQRWVEMSRYRWEVRERTEVYIPPIAFLAPPVVRAGRYETRVKTFLTHDKPEKTKTEDGKTSLVLRNALQIEDTYPLRHVAGYEVANPDTAEIIDRFPQK